VVAGERSLFVILAPILSRSPMAVANIMLAAVSKEERGKVADKLIESVGGDSAKTSIQALVIKLDSASLCG